MIAQAISLFILSVAILAVGLFKPKWILFWVEHPSRLMITAISMVLFMSAAVMFGEGTRQRQLAKQKQVAPLSADKPDIPVVVKPAQPPAQAPATSANDLRP